MNAPSPSSEFLLLSRGQWAPDSSQADIEAAIEGFYRWYESNLSSGRFKPGSRLSTDGAVVSKAGIVTDGPYGEAKEVIGGYWIIVARDLREAAEIAAENPCIAHGLTFEIRPLEADRASAYRPTNENLSSNPS